MSELNPTSKKTVWMACRATEGCEGNLAVIDHEFNHDIQMGNDTAYGGKTVRYVCQKCGRAFHISR